MDFAMVKQEQGETLCKYMRCFFDKCTTVVDVTDKEVIDLFQDGLYHRRTFEDFGRRRPKSIPHLKDMVTSWADEEDKATTPSTMPSVARASRTRAAAAATTGTRAVATITTTRIPTASASQTTLSRLSSTLRRRTRRRPLAASKTC
jgi:hypothetical protein